MDIIKRTRMTVISDRGFLPINGISTIFHIFPYSFTLNWQWTERDIKVKKNNPKKIQDMDKQGRY